MAVLTTTPKLNDYINRFENILINSILLMPKTNGSTTKNDLVNQIIKYEIPLAENPPEGLGPPHLFISVSPNVMTRKEPKGRSSINEQGPEKYFMEYYLIVVAQDPSSYQRSQEQLYTIIEAITTTLKKNLRMLDDASANPIANTLDIIVVPYLLQSDEITVVAKNIIVRPQVFVNLLP